MASFDRGTLSYMLLAVSRLLVALYFGFIFFIGLGFSGGLDSSTFLWVLTTVFSAGLFVFLPRSNLADASSRRFVLVIWVLAIACSTVKFSYMAVFEYRGVDAFDHWLRNLVFLLPVVIELWLRRAERETQDEPQIDV